MIKFKCHHCKKKTLYENVCKCKNTFCMNCLSSFVHNCSYDYKEEKKKQLGEDNPKILAQKIVVI
jgi:hypothetical protein